MKQKSKSWIVKRYQSGTIWLKKLDDKGFETEEGFIIGYFSADSLFLTRNQLRASRLDLARESLVSCICEGLNSIQEKPRPYIAGYFPSLLETGIENVLWFTDSYYGKIDFSYYRVESDNWIPTKIPESIIKEFRRLMEAFDKWDSSWND